MSPRQQTAHDHWGPDVPDWIAALAEACDQSSQNKVAERLGYSGAVVSQLLRKRYPGDVARVQQVIRAVLMREVTQCHALGEIALAECLEHRGNANKFRSPNPLRTRMRRACNTCPHHIGGRDANT